MSDDPQLTGDEPLLSQPRKPITGAEPQITGEVALRHALISLEDADWQVRKRAGELLKSWGDDAVVTLTSALHSDYLYTRRIAVQTLGLMRGDSVLDGLLVALDDPIEKVRQEAVLWIVPVMSSASDDLRTRAFDCLLSCGALDASSHIRERALRQLVELGDEWMQRFVARLYDPDMRLRTTALRVILRINPKLEGFTLDAEMVYRLCGIALEGGRSFTHLIRLLAPNTKVKSAQRRSGHFIAALLFLLGHESSQVQDLAKLWLCEYGDRQVADYFLRWVEPDLPHELRHRAVNAIARISYVEATDTIYRLTRDANPYVEAEAVIAYTKFHPSKAIPVIQAWLDRHPTSGLRYKAVQALNWIRSQDSFQLLVQIASSDQEQHFTRYVALSYLHRVSHWLELTDTIKAEMIAAIQSQWEIRSSRHNMFTAFEDILPLPVNTIEPVIDNLISHYESADYDSKIWIIRLIGKIKHKYGAPFLIERLNDNVIPFGPSIISLKLQQSAAKALFKLGTPDAIAAVKAWEQSKGAVSHNE